MEGVGLLASKVNYKQRGSGVLIIKSQQDSGSKFLPKRLNINLLTQIFNWISNCINCMYLQYGALRMRFINNSFWDLYSKR